MTDSTGNELRPDKLLNDSWVEKALVDSSGYYDEPLQFYLEEGEHMLTLETVREPIAIKSITLCSVEQPDSYEAYLQKHADAADYSGSDKFYVGEDILEKLRLDTAMQSNNIKTLFDGQYYQSYSEDPNFRITPNENVPKGEAYVSSSLNDYTEDGRAIGKEMTISADSIYNQDSMTVTVSQTYNKTNLESLTGIEYKDTGDGAIYVNEEDYNNLINKGIFQSSVYVEDVKKLDETLDSLNALGFNALPMRDALMQDGGELLQVINLMKTFMLALLIIALFFISYFIIRIVLKSRNAYYTTLRTLGASRKISKQLLDIELFLTATIAYAAFMAVMALVYTGVITQVMIVDLAGYLTVGNYILMYLIIIAMSYLISHRFSRKLFKDSVMNTYREEA